MRILTLVALGLGALALVGCEGIGTAAQSKTVQGAAVGSALGAGSGAIIGNQTGHAGAGTAVGAGLGAVAGGMVGHGMEEQPLPSAARKIKFCPVGGEFYDETVSYCPIHGAQLKYKE